MNVTERPEKAVGRVGIIGAYVKMAVSYRNFWSLNTDEAIVTGILRNYFKKKAEIFMPLNAQLKDTDILIVNTKNKKSITIQVKGSKAFEPKKSEKKRFGIGSGGWFFIPKEKSEIQRQIILFFWCIHLIKIIKLEGLV